MPASELAAHRLVLTAAELVILVDLCGVTLPPGFVAADVDDVARRRAAATLDGRGVTVPEPDANAKAPVGRRAGPSIVANLAVLAAPTVAVRVEASASGRGVRAVVAVSGWLGASLFALADGAVEVSMFPAEMLGRELIRAVPRPDELLPADDRIVVALGGGGAARLAGRLPLAALGEYQVSRSLAGGDPTGVVATDLGLTPAQARFAREVTGSMIGALWCLVTGRAGDGVLVGQVVWLATVSGWVGVRPDPDGSGQRMVALLPVAREDIGVWLAPYIGEILETAGE